jgi:type I restriction enzyme, S subunit
MSSNHRLGDVCEVVMGQAPSGENYNTEGIGWPLIAGAGDISDSGLDPKKYTTIAPKLCEPGDIILGIRASIGEKAIADRSYCIGRGVAALRSRPELEPKFLWHWLAYHAPSLAAKGRGATFAQVSRDDIVGLPIMLPDAVKQRRIAAMLDQAEVLRAKRREVLYQLDDLAHSVFFEMFGGLDEPTPWPREKLDGLARVIRGASPRPKGDPRYFGGEIPWLMISDLTRCADRVVRDVRETVTVAGKQKSVYLPPGTLVLTNSATVGLPRFLGVSACIHDGFLAFLDVDVKIHLQYLYSFFEQMRSRISDLAPEGTQKNLNTGIVKAIELPVPPLGLQEEFAQRVEAIERLKEKQRAHLAELDALLFASLQHRAFRGEL